MNDLSLIFYDGYEGIVKVLITAPILYVFVIVCIRFAGKRSTSQMNNFDWIVTVAIGSITASGIMLDKVSIAETMVAIALLLLLQYLLTYTIFRSSQVGNLVKASPRLLASEGQFDYEAMRKERVTKQEIIAAVRENGLVDIDDCQWVILETDATFSVIPKEDRDFSGVEFEDVAGFPPEK